MVFAAREAVRAVTFVLWCGELRPEREGEAILLKDGAGKTAYVMSAPVCMDSAKASEPVGVKVSTEPAAEPGVWRMTYTMPEAWLETATFPVTLDPTVITFNERCAMEDAYTCSKEPGTPHKGSWSNILRWTNGSGNWGQCHCLFKFWEGVLPTLEASDYVTKAELVVGTAQKGYPTAAFDATAHEVTEEWRPEGLTHNAMPAWENDSLDYSHFEANEGEGVNHGLDITNLVRKWYGGRTTG